MSHIGTELPLSQQRFPLLIKSRMAYSIFPWLERPQSPLWILTLLPCAHQFSYITSP